MNQTIIEKINSNYSTFSDTNRLIADSILNHEEETFEYTIKELANISFCVPSTIIKFLKLIGYDSYTIFKHELNESKNSSTIQVHNFQQSFQLVDDFLIKNKKLYKYFLKHFLSAEKVYIFSSGISRISAIDFTYKVNKLYLNKKIIFKFEPHEQKEHIKDINSKDLVLMISNSGEAKELIGFKKDIDNYFLVTNRNNSTLAKNSALTIDLNNTFENQKNFKDFSRDSKYSLVYFFDLLFSDIASIKKK